MLNNVVLYQQDGGIGHTANVSLSGNANVVLITQSGLDGDSNIGIRSRGSNNNFVITSNTTR